MSEPIRIPITVDLTPIGAKIGEVQRLFIDQAIEKEQLKDLLSRLLASWQEEVERNNFPTLLKTTLDLIVEIEKIVGQQ